MMQVVEAMTANGCCTVRVRAHALPRPMAALLEDSADILRHTLMRGDPARAQITTSSQPNVPQQEAASSAVPGEFKRLPSSTPAESPSVVEWPQVSDGVGAVPNGYASHEPRSVPDHADSSQAQSSATPAAGNQGGSEDSSGAGNRVPAAVHANGNAGEDGHHGDGADEIRRRSHGDATTSSAAHLEQGENQHHLQSRDAHMTSAEL